MAEWKKVIVSGSQAELNSLDLKGSSGNLVVEGNSTLGNAATDFARITGSADISGSLNVVSSAGVFRDKLFVGNRFAGNVIPSQLGSATLTAISSGSISALYLKTNSTVGSTGGQITLQSGQYQTSPIINHHTYNGNNTFKVETSGNITSLGDLSIAGNTTLGNTTADTTQITGSTDISGSLRVDGTLTVTGDTLQEDLRTTGVTRLGNDMGDKTEITGSLNVTGSSTFSGENAKITIDPDSTSAVIDVLDVGGGTLELIKMRDVAGGDQIRISRSGGQNSLELLDNGANSVKLDSKNDGFYLNNFAIGASSADASNTLSVTGNAKITTNLEVDGNTTLGNQSEIDKVEVSASMGLSGSLDIRRKRDDGGYLIHLGSLDETAAPGHSGQKTAAITMQGLANNSSAPQIRLLAHENYGGNEAILISSTGGTRYGVVEIKSNGSNDIKFTANEGGFINDKLTVGQTSIDSSATISAIGNIKASTGITGSYLTNDNILVAGSAGEVESSGITWDGSTLDLGAGNITSTGDLTIADARINGDLVVAGTASFENTENLKVTDRFISLASGSTAAGDGGIVIQQAATGLGEVFGFDNANGGRWGLRTSFDPTASLFTPTDFMVTTVKAAADPSNSTAPTYGGSNGHGNMHVNTSTGDIFIYA